MAGSTLRACVGPLLFGTAAAVAGRRVAGYRHRDEPVSALAARGSAGAKVMVPGYVALGVSSVTLAHDLRNATVVDRSVRRMLTVAGLTTIGAGVAQCSTRSCPSRFLGDVGATLSDDLHGIFSMATFLLWITTPLVSARQAQNVDRAYANRSAIIGASTFASSLITGALVGSRSERWAGVAQRVMVLSALSWFPVVARAARNTG